MSALVVLPSIYPGYTASCLATWKADAELLVVDNVSENRGVAASWNVGVDRVLSEEIDWLVLLSAAARFGPAGGRDLLADLERANERLWVVEPETTGWHLVAIRRQAFEVAGTFDENFHPAYFEDVDFSRRLMLATREDPPDATKVALEVRVQSIAHGMRKAGVVVPYRALALYYAAKWGGPSTRETYTTPFCLDRPVSWWPRLSRGSIVRKLDAALSDVRDAS